MAVNIEPKVFLDEDGLQAYHSGNMTKLENSINSHNSSSTSHEDMRSEITKINNKAEAIEEEVNSLDDKYSAKEHNHNNVYYTETEINGKIDELESYIDTKTSSLASTTIVDNKISAHNTSTETHNDIRTLIDELDTRLTTLANSDDTTLDQLSEIVDYIKSNRTLIEEVTTNKVNVADIINNLTTNVNNKPLSAAQGVVLKELVDALRVDVDGKALSSHTHAISDVTNLQTKLTELSEMDSELNDLKVTKSGDTMTGYLNWEKTVNGTNYKAVMGVANNGNTYIQHYTGGNQDNYITLSGSNSFVAKPWDISSGGTGATTAKEALVNFGLTATAAELNTLDGITATVTELNYVDGVTSNVQTQLDEKQANITGAATTITSNNLTANRALISNGSGKVAVSNVTNTELGYLSGVSSNVQEQIDNKTVVKIVRWS